MYNTYKLFANMGYDLGDGVQFYANGSYGHRDSQGYENYRKPSKIIDIAGDISSEPFPFGFDPREAIREQDYAFTFGLKGKTLDWNWDLSTTYGNDRDGVFTLNSANLDLFQATGATPTQFYDGIFEASEWTSNLDISHDFAVGFGVSAERRVRRRGAAQYVPHWLRRSGLLLRRRRTVVSRLQPS